MALLFAPAAFAALPAPAQQAEAGKSYKTVSAPEALVRCAGGMYYYPVTRLSEGEIVVVLGVDGEWTKVQYPSGCRAFVSSAVAERSEGEIRIVEPTRLKAANLNYGFRGSWKAVFDEPLPIGTTLTLVEPVVDDDGMTTAFLVEAPAGATGFVHTSSLRAASAEEIAQFKAALVPETIAAEAEETAPPVPADDDATELAQTPDDQPETTAQAEPKALEGPSDLESEPATPIVAIDQSTEETQPVGPTTREVASAAALDAAFETVFRQDVIDAEYDELIAEFKRALEALDTSTPEGQTTQRRMQQRVAVLELKRDVQNEQRALAEATRKIDERASTLASQLEQLSRTHAYTIVGRLVPSTVYNGERLPLMYRIQSVGQAVPRTLGYIRPDQSKDVTPKIGEVVGVVGDATLDRSLKLRVVRPERIDVLAPTTVVGAPDEDG